MWFIYYNNEIIVKRNKILTYMGKWIDLEANTEKDKIPRNKNVPPFL